MDAKAPPYIPSLIKDEDMYETINIRQPNIFRKSADHFINNYKEYLKDKQLTEQQLNEADEEANRIYSEIKTYAEIPPKNEYLTKIEDDYPDVDLWNLRLEEHIKEHNGQQPNYLDTSILWTECYMYRSIASFFFRSKYFKDYDIFEKTKREGLLSSRIAAAKLIEFTSEIASRIKDGKSSCEEEFENFIQVALWGNRFDLSVSYGHTNTDNFNPIEDLKKQKSKIVGNSTKAIFEHFKSLPNKKTQITFVLDNSGFELLGDICFIEMLYQTGLIDENSKIIFHDKLFPWFVSDVVHGTDMKWLLDCLENEFESEIVKKMSRRWSNFLNDGKNLWETRSHLFWSTPYSFAEMKRLAPDLYDELSKSNVVLFCGDLNYRKLISDFVWDPYTSFDVALRGFWPTNLVSIRTIKCKVVVDIDKNVKLPENYWEFGKYAVIHFYKKKD